MRVGPVRPAIVNTVQTTDEHTCIAFRILVSVPPDCEQFSGDQGAVRLKSVNPPSHALLSSRAEDWLLGSVPVTCLKSRVSVSSPARKRAEQVCHDSALREPLFVLSDTAEGLFRRAIFRLARSIADAKARTTLLNLMDCG